MTVCISAPIMTAMPRAISVETLRHSTAHLMAAAVKKRFPAARLGIGPVIDDGFYYDFDTKADLSPSSFAAIENEMRAMIAQKLPFRKEWMTTARAIAFFRKRKEPHKMELIGELRRKGIKKVSVYWTGEHFADLCTGPHLRSTGDIPRDAFALTKTAGAYWRGDEKNAQLKRLYGTAWPTKQELDTYLAMLKEAERRDHKRLGPALDLFTFSDLVGSGLPLWTPKGTLIRTLLDDFVWRLREARGYERVEIPHITKKELFEKSGHWEKFGEDLFRVTSREGHLFAIKPMNCPHHTQIYKRKLFSYRELPQRYANTTMAYRDEQSGELAGLSRTRGFTQDDAHVFCRNAQVKEEMLKVWDIVDAFYGAFGFSLRVRLSFHDPKRPKDYLGEKSTWRKAEKEIIALAEARGAKAERAPGEAAFYGPKVDFLAKDSLGREWQVATIQLDMNLPERFDLSCVDEKGKPERIVMIHAAIMGSIERFLAILIEHVAGDFPVWLAPVQVRVLPIAERHHAQAESAIAALKKSGVRAELSPAGETLGKRIREGELNKIPYLAVLGDREESEGTLTIRSRGSNRQETLTPETFAARIREGAPR